MNGFKTNYNISDVIRILRYICEPWLENIDELSNSDSKVMERWKKNNKALKDNSVSFTCYPKTVDDIEKTIMNKKDYMNIYANALMDCISEPGVDILYDDDKAELTIVKGGSAVYHSRYSENEYDTKAKLLLNYIRGRMGIEIMS